MDRAVTLEVAPTRDLFVPFEFPVVELPSGWYAIECRVAIDGSPETVRPGSRFAIPWPRGATRRDRVRVGRAVEVAGQKVRLDELECRATRSSSGTTGPEASFTLTADGTRVPVLEATFDEETGAGTVTRIRS